MSEREDRKKLEEEFSHLLQEGEMERVDPQQAAPKHILPRYEIRVRAEKDPIVEETMVYRQMAEEVSDRYDRYLDSIPSEEGPANEKKEDPDS